MKGIYPLLPPLSETQKAALTAIHKHDQEQLEQATARLEEAQEAVEYWTRQQQASSSLVSRMYNSVGKPEQSGRAANVTTA